LERLINTFDITGTEYVEPLLEEERKKITLILSATF
jgi:hypothetical protein